MPEHDLEPPRFARKALERILNDWTAVKAMLLTGYTGQQEDNARYPQKNIHIKKHFRVDFWILGTTASIMQSDVSRSISAYLSS